MAYCCSPDLKDMRKFSASGHGGVFKISDDDFDLQINKRVKESGWKSVNIGRRDAGFQEFSIYLSNVKDTTLKEVGYEPNDYMEISVTLHVKVGATDGDLELGHFTATKDTLNPYLVDYKRTVVLKQLDTTKPTANSATWSIKDDSGELEINVVRKAGQPNALYASHRNTECPQYTLKTDFPNTLDWGCDKIPEVNKPQFCSRLSKHSSEILAAGKHISNINEVKYGDSQDGGTTCVMEIKKITGIFKKILPFVHEGQTSEHAFLDGISHETVGISYNCLTEK